MCLHPHNSPQHHKSLLAFAIRRIVDFESFVTSTPSISGSDMLPSSAASLGAATRALAHAALNQACNGALDWAALRGAVISQLEGQGPVIGGIDMKVLQQEAMYDYVKRATEALVVGTSLALQAALLAAFAEFECQLRVKPRTAVITNPAPVQDASHMLLTQLARVLASNQPSNPVMTPVQRCLSTRVDAVMLALQSGSTLQDLSCHLTFVAGFMIPQHINPYRFLLLRKLNHDHHPGYLFPAQVKSAGYISMTVTTLHS